VYTGPLKSDFLNTVKSSRLGWVSITALSIDRDLDSSENLSLEVESHQVIPREVPSFQRRFLSLQNYRVRLHACDQQIGIQKFERDFSISTFVHQVEARPGFCQIDLQSYSRQ